MTVVVVTVVVVLVVNKEPKHDSAEATAEQSVQCAVCLASVDDEVHGVLDGDELLDTDGQGQVCLKNMIHKAPVIINMVGNSRVFFSHAERYVEQVSQPRTRNPHIYQTSYEIEDIFCLGIDQ